MFFIIFFKYLLIVTSLFISKIIPYAGFFPYGERLNHYNLPTLISRLGSFDGIHYLINAQEGYHTYEQAFFPLFPFLIRILNPIFFRNTFITGLIISNLSFIGSIFLIKKILEELKVNKKTQLWIIVFLVSYPFSFYFNVIYTESLFLFLFTLTFYFYYIKKNTFNYLISSIFLSLTRLIGVFFFIVPIFSYIKNKDKKYLFHSLIPFIGLSIYMIFLKITTNDPLKFLSSQPAFGANRSSKLILPIQTIYRYIKIFLTSSINYQYMIALTEFIVFIITLFILSLLTIKYLKKKNFLLLSIIIFSFANLIIPSLTGTLSSIPRYSIFSFSLYYYLALIKSNKIKIIILLTFILLHTLFFSLFLQGYFVA